MSHSIALEKKIERRTKRERGIDGHRKKRNRISSLGTIEQTMDHGVCRLSRSGQCLFDHGPFFSYMLHG